MAGIQGLGSTQPNKGYQFLVDTSKQESVRTAYQTLGSLLNGSASAPQQQAQSAPQTAPTAPQAPEDGKKDMFGLPDPLGITNKITGLFGLGKK
jgi:hypothetical protein